MKKRVYIGTLSNWLLNCINFIKTHTMSTHTKQVNQTVVQMESPTLLTKLEQLDAQMKLAFPSSSKKANELTEIKSPTSFQSSNKPAIQSKNENKENINVNEKSIIDKMSKQIKISELKSNEQLLSSITKSVDITKNNNPSISTNASEPLDSVTTTATSNTLNVNNNTPATAKHLSAWKRTKILSKTLSSMEVVRVMKSKTASAQPSSTPTITPVLNSQSQNQNLKAKDNTENQLKKSSSGNILSTTGADNYHYLNSPLNQIKRRSQEEVSTELIANPAGRLSASSQTSIHNLNETGKANTQASSIKAALNNLNVSTGTYQIPDNYNTTIINQLNKNYLKNMQKQTKARSDWKSLKSKLIGLGRKESEDNSTNDKTIETSESLTSSANCNTSTTNQRKLSNSNPAADDGIICKKEDLLFLLRNSNLMNKKAKSNKPSLADVVVQLQENKARKTNSSTASNQQQICKDKISKNQSDLKENLVKTSTTSASSQINNKLNQSTVINNESNSILSTSIGKANSTNLTATKSKQTTSNGRVQFVLATSEQSTPTNSQTTTSTVTKIKSSLKKTTSSANSSIDKNQSNLLRQTKSNTINNSNLNLHKKKVKIFETDQDGIRKALMLQSVKDRNNNNNENLLNNDDESNDEKQIKINTQNENLEEEESNEELQTKIAWDEQNVVDAGVLGDAIASFLSSITKNPTSSNPSTTTYSATKPLATTEKKVSFKK